MDTHMQTDFHAEPVDTNTLTHSQKANLRKRRMRKNRKLKYKNLQVGSSSSSSCTLEMKEAPDNEPECKESDNMEMKSLEVLTEPKMNRKERERLERKMFQMANSEAKRLRKRIVKQKKNLGLKDEDDIPQIMLYPSPERACIGCFPKKKLLVLEVNGVLADIVPNEMVFKRPFCDDFLDFCFERFHVGVWSSMEEGELDAVIRFLMGDSRLNLLFCWNLSQCTATGFNAIWNHNKPLVLKELRKLWEKLGHDDLPYNESNTLLLDDSPNKALRNPAYTSIFPYSFKSWHKEDFSLGPGGDLRKYMEELAVVENVQKYVQQNPFGQQAITESSPDWDFYLKIIGTTHADL